MASFDEATKSVRMRRVIERVPYVGSGVSSLIAQVGAILRTEQAAQRVILDVTKSYIHVERLVKGVADQDEEQERYDNVLRTCPMNEYAPDAKLAPYEYLFKLFKQVTDEDLEVTHVLVGSLQMLHKWVALSTRSPKLYGVRVKQLRNIPDDVIIICGSEWLEAEPEDVRYTVKGVIS